MLSITTLKVNLVESSGSLTPEELGQKQGMSVVLARYFSLNFGYQYFFWVG